MDSPEDANVFNIQEYYFKKGDNYPFLENNIERIEKLIDVLVKESEMLLNETRKLRIELFKVIEKFGDYYFC